MSGNGNIRGLGSRFKNAFLGNTRKHKDPTRNLGPGEEGRPLTMRLRHLFTGYPGKNKRNQTSNARKNNSSGNNTTRRRSNSGNNNGSNSNSNSNNAFNKELTSNNSYISERFRPLVVKVKTALKNNEEIELTRNEFEIIKAYKPNLAKRFTEVKGAANGPYAFFPSTWVFKSK